ncbi:hypothetical protein [Actinacidiphila sp. ITFR-21]|uniref:hypothetical protein n=1 Tax=Actinacidiphila sp. ITFR-21 TaxID=3075199 RepID=UPI0028892EC4|nr:hypothetical protein [Streptomyces sp. ITFR-21]WNI19175.1 hypothetical protein RLT57_28970 [Streptomyces sp. ITFR-21]
MAKSSGLGWTTFSIDNAAGTPVDIRNDTTDLQFATPRAVWDVTGIDKSANERLLLLADATVTANTVFNPTGAHTVFSTIPSTSVLRTVSIGVGGKSLAMEMLGTDYPLQRSNSGELTASVPFSLADGTVPTWS